MKLTVTKIFRFEAAHYLPLHEGKCKNLHGHSYVLEIEVIRKQSSGSLHLIVEGLKELPLELKDCMVVDFGDIKRIVTHNIIDYLDHKTLNHLDSLTIDGCFFPHLNPTAEMIATWIFFVLDSRMDKDGLSLCKIKRVRLWETVTSYAEIQR